MYLLKHFLTCVNFKSAFKINFISIYFPINNLIFLSLLIRTNQQFVIHLLIFNQNPNLYPCPIARIQIPLWGKIKKRKKVNWKCNVRFVQKQYKTHHM